MVQSFREFGKRGELASNRHEEQELGMLCLHILQSSLGLINTLMIQAPSRCPDGRHPPCKPSKTRS